MRRWIPVLMSMLAAVPGAWGVKTAAPLEVDLRLELPKAFPAAATAVFMATCQVDAPSLMLWLELPASYPWIAGATQMQGAAQAGATQSLVVCFLVREATSALIEGRAVVAADGGLRIERSAAIPLLPPALPRAGQRPEEAPFEERDGTARYPGRTRTAP